MTPTQRPMMSGSAVQQALKAKDDEILRLKEALRKYGEHKAGCAYGEIPANGKPCDCGLDTALQAGDGR